MSNIDYLRNLPEQLTPGIVDKILDIVRKEGLVFFPELTARGISYLIQKPSEKNGMVFGEEITAIFHQNLPRSYVSSVISHVESQQNKKLMAYLGLELP